MNDSEQRCAECGVELPAGIPLGLCPNCALKGVLEVSSKNSATTSATPPASEAGERIGRYKLLEKIGEGGCGIVYMAEQEEPVRRRVALKVIKPGMDTHEVIARFEAERQALALMEHPHIAKVFDAGATHAGRPYFVMELVRGLRITDYCDQKNLSTRQRLDLFMQVCQAVQHAHQKGIIHRDLKPSNILVTVNDGAPVPKVIDFGVAKATGQRLTDKTLFTKFQQLIGTPAYMSPEQAEMTSVDIDTRSDIYSLGVLLYELLTSRTPFDAKKLLQSGVEEMLRTIRGQEPARPSARLGTLAQIDRTTVAQQRQTDGPKLISLVRGDLDWIVMKCLEKDRARRYETASGLAMDLQRHLDQEPVLARSPTTAYRVQKFVRRNKFAFATASIVTFALTIGFGTSTWMFFGERNSRRRAVAAELHQAVLRVEAEWSRGNESRLRFEAETASANEARLRQEAESARANEARLREQAESAEKIAQAEAAQLGQVLMQLDKLDQAEEFIRKGLAMQRKKPEDHGWEIAASLNNLGNVLMGQGKNLPEAEAACREALALRKTLVGEEHIDVANSLDRLAMSLSMQGKYGEAEAANRDALAIRRKLLGDDHMDVANSLLRLGSVLTSANRFVEAEPAYAEVLVIARKLNGNEHPYVHSVLNIVSEGLFQNNRAAEAEPLVRECLRIREKKMPDEVLTFMTRNLLGAVLMEQGKYPEAEPLLLSSWEALNQRATEEPTQSKTSLEKALLRLIRLYDLTEQPARANACRNEIELLRRKK
jgi:eukaryotic-like serine/threonine-protein kinase